MSRRGCGVVVKRQTREPTHYWRFKPRCHYTVCQSVPSPDGHAAVASWSQSPFLSLPAYCSYHIQGPIILIGTEEMSNIAQCQRNNALSPNEIPAEVSKLTVKVNISVMYMYNTCLKKSVFCSLCKTARQIFQGPLLGCRQYRTHARQGQRHKRDCSGSTPEAISPQ